jgi:hypothetical protein
MRTLVRVNGLGPKFGIEAQRILRGGGEFVMKLRRFLSGPLSVILSMEFIGCLITSLSVRHIWSFWFSSNVENEIYQLSSDDVMRYVTI